MVSSYTFVCYSQVCYIYDLYQTPGGYSQVGDIWPHLPHFLIHAQRHIGQYIELHAAHLIIHCSKTGVVQTSIFARFIVSGVLV